MEKTEDIIKLLKKNPSGLWIREISRRSNLHMETVRRIVSRNKNLFETIEYKTANKVNLKIIKLKKR